MLFFIPTTFLFFENGKDACMKIQLFVVLILFLFSKISKDATFLRAVLICF